MSPLSSIGAARPAVFSAPISLAAVESFFDLHARKTTVARELRGGMSTFVTMLLVPLTYSIAHGNTVARLHCSTGHIRRGNRVGSIPGRTASNYSSRRIPGARRFKKAGRRVLA
jgi:hypothetical protein